MRRFLLLALLALAPWQAQAYEASIVFTGCNQTQEDALRAGLERVDTKLTWLLAQFDKPETQPYLKAWFGSVPRTKIRERYQRIRNMLDRPRTVILACEERQCQHDLFGYAEGHSISMCPDFFASKLAEGYDTQAGTIIHEFSHSFAETDDHAYGTGRARILAHEDPRKAATNADSYQYFFEAMTGDNVPYADVAWNQANSCEWAYDGECDHPGSGTGSCQPMTDTTDCEMANQRAEQAQSFRSLRKSHFGPINTKDSCTTALNGSCDTSCAPGTDYTDCLTGTGRRK